MLSFVKNMKDKLNNTIAWLIFHQFHWYMLFFMICTCVLTAHESYWLEVMLIIV